MPKQRILILSDYYTPGYLGGGVIRAVANLVEHLGDEFEFKIITRNRDFGSDASYPGVTADRWTRIGNADVMYLSPSGLTTRYVVQLINQTPHDLLYLNSVFSPFFGIIPLLARRFGALSSPQILIAPHGELSPGALQIKSIKKWLCLFCMKSVGCYKRVAWHVSTRIEGDQLSRVLGPDISACEAQDLPTIDDASRIVEIGTRTKSAGSLSMFFLSRISRKKNLDWILKVLKDVIGTVHFHIYGPREDEAYWVECLNLIKMLPPNVTVTVHGSVLPEKVISAMAPHHLFVLPTKDENFGYVVLEALLAGCPVLVSDKTPWSELESRGAGWAVSLDDPERFRSVIESCIAMGNQDFQRMSVNAREMALATVSNDNVKEQYREMFKAAIWG